MFVYIESDFNIIMRVLTLTRPVHNEREEIWHGEQSNIVCALLSRNIGILIRIRFNYAMCLHRSRSRLSNPADNKRAFAGVNSAVSYYSALIAKCELNCI